MSALLLSTADLSDAQDCDLINPTEDAHFELFAEHGKFTIRDEDGGQVVLPAGVLRNVIRTLIHSPEGQVLRLSRIAA